MTSQLSPMMMGADERLTLTLDAALAIRTRALAEQDPPLWIYAIRAGEYGGDIKLGLSGDPIARLASLQVACSEQLHGVAAWRALAIEERWLHEECAGSRIRGEWFMHSLSLWRYLKSRGGDFRWKR